MAKKKRQLPTKTNIPAVARKTCLLPVVETRVVMKRPSAAGMKCPARKLRSGSRCSWQQWQAKIEWVSTKLGQDIAELKKEKEVDAHKKEWWKAKALQQQKAAETRNYQIQMLRQELIQVKLSQEQRVQERVDQMLRGPGLAMSQILPS